MVKSEKSLTGTALMGAIFAGAAHEMGYAAGLALKENSFRVAYLLLVRQEAAKNGLFQVPVAVTGLHAGP